jgi:hypothetical protein
MTAKKVADVPLGQIPLGGEKTRRPWVKKTPVENVIAQIKRQREAVEKQEAELKLARRQLQKLEEVQKILESA